MMVDISCDGGDNVCDDVYVAMVMFNKHMFY